MLCCNNDKPFTRQEKRFAYRDYRKKYYCEKGHNYLKEIAKAAKVGAVIVKLWSNVNGIFLSNERCNKNSVSVNYSRRKCTPINGFKNGKKNTFRY